MTALGHKRDAQNIFSISELFAMIARLCDKSDLARLSRVCRATFYEATPLVWKRVEGVHNFLGLLPGIRVIKQGREDRVTLMVSSRVVHASELARLPLYVASIRDIKIYNTVVRHYDVTDWQILDSGLESQMLPPGLESLDLTGDCLDCAHYQPLWVKVFACNSLTTVSSIPSSLEINSVLSTIYLNGLVELLVKKSPDVKRLSLYVCFGSHDVQESVGNALIPLACTEPPFESSLTSLSKLQHLECSSDVLYCAFDSVGSLPQLRSLTVWPNRSMNVHYTQESLSSTSFPVLTQLTLHLGTLEEVKSLLTMTIVLRRVTTLKIFMDEDSWIAKGSSVVSSVFLQLRNVPLLRGLYIQLRPMPNFEVTYTLCTVGYRALMDATSVLPLQKISLDSICFENASPFHGIQASWSQITHLCMPNQHVRNRDLAHLSTLPNLQYLLLTLLLSHELPAKDSLAISGGTMLHILNGSPDSRMRTYFFYNFGQTCSQSNAR